MAKKTKCEECGFEIRGKNHVKGVHHRYGTNGRIDRTRPARES